MYKLIKGVRAQSARQILLIICKTSVYVNTVVRCDVDMMLHSDLPRAPQLVSPLLLRYPIIEESQSVSGVASLCHSNDTIVGVATEI